MPATHERPGRSACPCQNTQNSNALTKACAQGNNESLANAAFVFITQESLDALKLVLEQLPQFYKTSAKVTVETVQYALDSTYKAAQKEWTRIEGMIQSEFERIIQETHAVENAEQEVSILAERTET